jgi:hypothetical protein
MMPSQRHCAPGWSQAGSNGVFKAAGGGGVGGRVGSIMRTELFIDRRCALPVFYPLVSQARSRCVSIVTV